MREVIKWNEDKINKKRTELKCLKPDNGLIGKATIQLFDMDGNLKNETYTENIIPTWLTEGQWYRNLYQSVNGGDLSNSFTNIPTAFSKIYLTSYSGEEDAEDRLARGAVIGWSPRTDQNVGNDSTRGAYNPAESFEKITEDRYKHYHLVYDFGTSNGNGTFNAVYWARNSITKSKKLCPITVCELNRLEAKSIDVNIINSSDGRYLKQGGDKKWYEVLNIDAHVAGLESVALATEPTTPIYAKDLMGNGHKIQIVESGANDFGRSVFDVMVSDDVNTTPTSATQISVANSFPELKPAMDGNFRSWVRLTAQKRFKNGDVMMEYRLYSATNDLPQYSNGVATGNKTDVLYAYGVFNVVSGNWVINLTYKGDVVPELLKVYNATGFSSSIVEINGVDFELARGNELTIGLVNRESYSKYSRESFTSKDYSNINVTSTTNWYYKKENLIISSDSKILKILPYSAHTKLPAPVTKTSADTMKIQYDYYIQIPNTIPINGDYINPPIGNISKE